MAQVFETLPCGDKKLFILHSQYHDCWWLDDARTKESWLHGINSHGTAWRPHQMETFSALLALCAGNSPVTSEFPAQRPVTRSFDVSFDLRLNKWLCKQLWGWWFETPSYSLRCPRNDPVIPEYTGGCFTNVSWTLRNIFSKVVYRRIHTSYKNIKLKFCTCAQSQMYKVSAWNSHYKCDFWHYIFSWYYLGEKG